MLEREVGVTKLVITSITRSGHNFIRNNLMSWKKYEKYLNLETENPKNHQVNMKRYKIGVDVNNIIVVRDLLNWLSSYLKIQLNEKKNIQQVYNYMGVWEQISKEAFNETNYIPNKIIINYDRFKNSIEYRKEICKKIGGNYNERKLNEVPKNGNFSSFDSNKYKNNGNKMKTNERYKYFIGHEMENIYFDVIKTHPKTIKLYEDNFILNNEQKEIIIKIKNIIKI